MEKAIGSHMRLKQAIIEHNSRLYAVQVSGLCIGQTVQSSIFIRTASVLGSAYKIGEVLVQKSVDPNLSPQAVLTEAQILLSDWVRQ